jgi:hypothetical protein
MSNIIVSREAINKLINIGATKRELYCFHCKEYTEHVQVSYAEQTKKTGEKIWCRFLNIVPLVPSIVGNSFACKNCGHFRHEGGLLTDKINKSDFVA